MNDNPQIPTVPPEMTEDQVLAYTQGKRKHIVDTLTLNGKVPEDKTEVSFLISALDGMDRAALTTKRIKSDEKSAAGITGAASIIAKLLMQTNNRNNVIDELIEPPLIGSDVPDPILVPGETEINPGPMTFDSFTSVIQNNEKPSSGS